ncbi:MAG: hypothetical protein AB9M60_22200 [Leptothrix sp. (in: b-proteobacteria)]
MGSRPTGVDLDLVADLDKLRPILEDLGGGRGLTEPWSGEVALHMAA